MSFTQIHICIHNLYTSIIVIIFYTVRPILHSTDKEGSRVMFNLPKFSHVIPLFRDLHCSILHQIQDDGTSLQGGQFNCSCLPPSIGQTRTRAQRLRSNISTRHLVPSSLRAAKSWTTKSQLFFGVYDNYPMLAELLKKCPEVRQVLIFGHARPQDVIQVLKKKRQLP